MTAPAAVTPVRAAFGDIFGAVKMHRPRPSVTGMTKDFYVVYKVAFCHL